MPETDERHRTPLLPQQKTPSTRSTRTAAIGIRLERPLPAVIQCRTHVRENAWPPTVPRAPSGSSASRGQSARKRSSRGLLAPGAWASGGQFTRPPFSPRDDSLPLPARPPPDRKGAACSVSRSSYRPARPLSRRSSLNVVGARNRGTGARRSRASLSEETMGGRFRLATGWPQPRQASGPSSAGGASFLVDTPRPCRGRRRRDADDPRPLSRHATRPARRRGQEGA
jgi:hypothetical protein